MKNIVQSLTGHRSYVHLIKLPKQNFYVAMKNIEMSPTGLLKLNVPFMFVTNYPHKQSRLF